jgi:uncharacterized protein (DUF1015 family)
LTRILPFRGITYDLGRVGESLEDLLAPPYDCISEEERKELEARSPYNVVRLILPKGYEEASRRFRSWLEDGILKEDPDPSFYVYELEYEVDGRRRDVLGLIALLEVGGDHVLLHERTFPEPVRDRLSLISASMANFEGIIGLYEDQDGDVGKILELRKGPAIEARWRDGSVHRVWGVDPKLVGDLPIAMKGKDILIADGHHRYEASLALRRHMDEMAGPGPWDYAMAFLFETRGLSILSYHRLIRGISGGIEGTLARLSSRFDLEIGKGSLLDEVMAESSQHHVFGLYFGKGRYGILRVKRGSYGDPVRALDLSAFHDIVMEWVGDVDGMAYTYDKEEAIALVDSGDYDLAVIIRPVSPDEVWAVARAGGRMPQKATYFHPKPLSGLVMRRMEEVRRCSM